MKSQYPIMNIINNIILVFVTKCHIHNSSASWTATVLAQWSNGLMQRITQRAFFCAFVCIPLQVQRYGDHECHRNSKMGFYANVYWLTHPRDARFLICVFLLLISSTIPVRVSWKIGVSFSKIIVRFSN